MVWEGDVLRTQMLPVSGRNICSNPHSSKFDLDEALQLNLDQGENVLLYEEETRPRRKSPARVCEENLKGAIGRRV